MDKAKRKPPCRRRKASRLEMYDLARDLYLTPLETDPTKHKYCLQACSDELRQRFSNGFDRTTLSRKCKEEDWNGLWERGLKNGFNAQPHENSQAGKDEQIIERNAAAVAVVHQRLEFFHDLSHGVLMETIQREKRKLDADPSYKVSVPVLKVIGSKYLDVAKQLLEYETGRNNGEVIKIIFSEEAQPEKESADDIQPTTEQALEVSEGLPS